jgi:predicted DNA-binding transcriptional regulator AlpA
MTMGGSADEIRTSELHDHVEARTTEPGTKANPLLPLSTVARRIGHSKRSVRRLLREGAFPGAQRVGAKLCVPELEVLAFLRRERERHPGETS